MSESIENIVPFVQFNAKALPTFFSHIPQTDLEKKAIEFLYGMLDQEIGNTSLSKLERQKLVTSLAFEKLQFSLEIYHHHSRFFPLSDNIVYRQALSLAIICDEYVHEINALIPPQAHNNDNTYVPMFRNDGFDERIVAHASYFWDAAKDIVEEGIPEDMQEIEPEILFLAHLHGLLKLREMERMCAQFSHDQLIEILKKDIPAIQTFAHPQYTIGHDLYTWTGRMEDRIVSFLPSVYIYPAPRPKPALTLIQTEDPPAP